MKKILALLLFLTASHLSLLSASGQTTAGSITITGSPLAMTLPACVDQAKQNVSYNCSLGATNGAGSGYTWNVISGGPPAGITFSTTTGTFSGTPTGTSSGRQVTQLCDAANTCIQASVTITPAALSSIAVTPTGQSIQTSQTQQLAAKGTWVDGSTSDLSALATWSCTGTCGTVSSTGLFTAGNSSGTATIKAVFNGVTDDGGSGIGVTVSANNPTIQSSLTLPNGQLNEPYAENGGAGVQLAASGGTAPYTWTLSSGSLQGLSLSSGGLITGTATGTGGTTSPVIQVCDSGSNCTSGTFSLTVATISSVAIQIGSTVCSTGVSCATIQAGAQQQFQLVATFSDSSKADITNLVTGGTALSVAQVAKCIATSATACTATFTNATATGNFIYFCSRNGVNNTSTLSITDSASQTGYAQVGTYNTSYGPRESGCFFKPNSASLTTITGTWSGSLTTTVNGVAYEIAGPPTSSPLDSNASNPANAGQNTTNVTSTALGSLSTTNANDILLALLDVATNQTTLTQPTGFTCPPNSTPLTDSSGNGRLALCYQIVSTAQSGPSLSYSWSPTAYRAGTIFAALKSAGGAGSAWTAADLSGTSVANVCGQGCIAGNAAGTSTITATDPSGFFSANTVLTVQAPSDTSLVISPSSGNCPVGGTLSFTVQGQPSGSNDTQQAVWGSNAPASIAPTATKGVFNCVAAGGTSITATVGSLSASAPVTISSVGNASLLQGCVVTGPNPTSTASVTGCTNTWPPSGWSMVIADGAENGVPSGVVLDAFGTHICTTGSSNTLGFPYVAHTGTHSYCNLIGGDGQEILVFYHLPNGYSQLYLSFWDSTDPDALYPNSDYEFVQIRGQNNCTVGPQAQANFNPASSLNSNYFPLYAKKGTPTNGTACNDNFWYNGPFISPNPPIDAGTQVQWEVLYIPNTTFASDAWVNGAPPSSCTSSTQAGCGNGTLKMWRNGVLVMDYENANLNSGFLSQMTNSASLVIGGFDTSFSSTGAIRCTTWSMTGGGTCPGPQPGTGAPKPHYRYIDDVIILKK